MKRKALALALLLGIFVSLVSGINAVKIVTANFVPGPPSIFIDSPETNKTYTTNSIWLNITLKAFFDSGNVSRIVECSLDGKENTSIPVVYEGLDEDYFSTVTGSLLLSDLTEGSYSMTVYATYHFLEPWKLFYSNSETVNFVIELPKPTPYKELHQTGQEVILGVAVTIGVLCIGLGLLLYLIKRK